MKNSMEKLSFAFLGRNFVMTAEKGRLIRIEPSPKVFREGSPFLRDVRIQLEAYFSGKRKQFDIPFTLQGVSSFQRAIYEAVLLIPYGQKRSYADIAREIGLPKAVRAVGTALGKNPLPFLIPCHRVIRSDGDYGNYAFGREMKAYLLRMEEKG